MTVMNRLEEKGILKIVEVVNRANVFFPTYPREGFLEIATGLIVESLLNDFPEQMSIHFKKHSKSSCDQEKLEALSEKVEAKRKTKKDKKE
jgi:predicted transcriptional regulator